MNKTIQIQVYGKVQGVWYRASTQKKAKDLNLTGFVENRPDGSVYLEAEGAAAAISQLIEWCKEGPPFAEVKELLVEEISTGNYSDFVIKR